MPTTLKMKDLNKKLRNQKMIRENWKEKSLKTWKKLQ